MNLAYWLNTAWCWQCRREGIAFRHSFSRVRQTQESVLRAILRQGVRSVYGRVHGFDRAHSIEDFQQRVPLSDYDSLAEYVDRIADGESRVLTGERVKLLEPTSGSTSAEKLIPYTAGLRRQFHRAVSAWVWDVMHHFPAVRRGRAFWSISPPRLTDRRTPSGIPVGFDSDVQYLSRMQRRIVSRLLVIPSEIQSVRQLDQFRYAMLLYLLRAADVALISVWSPTFLTAILDRLEEWLEAICADLRRGTLRPPASPPGDKSSGLQLLPDPRRADVLWRLLRGPGSIGDRLTECWPRLSLISCWADASAESHVARLREYFPHVTLQPKGLIATEGVVSVPLSGSEGAALAVRSHFFEFENIGDDVVAGRDRSTLVLAHQLELGKRYRVVLTTAGGLYRYVLGDVVEVVGFRQQCPLLRFAGRSGCVSDLVGEKLNEAHVRTAMEGSFHKLGIQPHFAMLVPIVGQPPRYRLYVVCADVDAGSVLFSRLATTLQSHLEENPHYRYATGIGQLGSVEARPLDTDARTAWACYERRCLQRGQRPGDIKPVALELSTGWDEVFRGFTPE